MSPRILFEQELEVLRDKVARMGERAQISYGHLICAVKGDDREKLTQLLDADQIMLDMQRSIETLCLGLLTRQQPVARDLRAVTASLKVVTDIERIGDHVSDMAELFLRVEKGYDYTVQAPRLLAMMKEAEEMLNEAAEAFVNQDMMAARRVIARDDAVDDYFNLIKEDMMQAIRSQAPDAERTVDFLMIAKYLEKVGDHAVNIGEWTVFKATGDIQDVRIY